MLQSQPEFSAVAKMLLNAVRGATIVHVVYASFVQALYTEC